MNHLEEPDLLIELEVVGLQVRHLPGQHAHLQGVCEVLAVMETLHWRWRNLYLLLLLQSQRL